MNTVPMNFINVVSAVPINFTQFFFATEHAMITKHFDKAVYKSSGEQPANTTPQLAWHKRELQNCLWVDGTIYASPHGKPKNRWLWSIFKTNYGRSLFASMLTVASMCCFVRGWCWSSERVSQRVSFKPWSQFYVHASIPWILL